MPEETPNEQVEEQPQEPETAPEAEGSEEEPFDADRAKKAINKRNAENKSLRDRLKELEPLARKAKELEDAQKTEQERLTEQLTAQQEKAAKAIRTAVASKVEALAASNFADPEDAAGALNLPDYVDVHAVEVIGLAIAGVARQPHRHIVAALHQRPEHGMRHPLGAGVVARRVAVQPGHDLHRRPAAGPAGGHEAPPAARYLTKASSSPRTNP